jgi:hypothetical protein
MRIRLSNFLVRHNRALLVLATVILAISGSRAAGDLRSMGDWLVVLGSGALLF